MRHTCTCTFVRRDVRHVPYHYPSHTLHSSHQKRVRFGIEIWARLHLILAVQVLVVLGMWYYSIGVVNGYSTCTQALITILVQVLQYLSLIQYGQHTPYWSAKNTRGKGVNDYYTQVLLAL
jgi:hypothetical protein